jgi:nickel/cobalt transporter (NicO) family protein
MAFLRSGLRCRPRSAALLVAVLLVAVSVQELGPALAQGPFGVGRPPPAGLGGLEGPLGFLLAKQAEFYRELAGLIRAAKSDGRAIFGLLGVSFAYGIFHAAGPGHGKAVISAYLVANEETWRRGLVLSFLSALMQALVAVALVGIAAALLGTTAKMMGDSVRVIETVSYGLILALGGRLVWSKGSQWINAWRQTVGSPPTVGVAGAQAHAAPMVGPPCEPDAEHHAFSHSMLAGSAKGAHQSCGHAHGPDLRALAGPGGFKRGLSAIFAVGLRPCSGAILVLVFALAQGLFWAGVASTLVMGLGTAITVAVIATFALGAKGLAARLVQGRSRYASLVLGSLELVAAAAVFAIGVLLLGGYLASERLFAV